MTNPLPTTTVEIKKSNTTHKSEVLSFESGQIIFTEGQPSNGIYLVQEGNLEVFQTRDGLEIQLSVMGPGEVLGTMTVLSRNPRMASARATSKCMLAFYPSEGIADGLKSLPVWAQAIVKDTIARIKTVNERLVEAKLIEKNLTRTAGNVFHHSSQLAYLFAAFARKENMVDESNIPIYPLKDFVTLAEPILLKKYTYLEQIFNAFIENGLIKTVDDKRYGKIAQNPNLPVIEEYAVFAIDIAKKGTNLFIPRKCYNWMQSAIRISKKLNNLEQFKRQQLADLMGTDLNRNDCDIMIGELLKLQVLTETENLIVVKAKKLQKTIIFESICRALKDINK